MHGAGAVVHVREHEDGHIGAQRLSDVFGLDQHQLQTVLLAQRLGDVEVGGEIAALAHDALGVWAIGLGDVNGRAQDLEEVDGRAVGGHHLARARADQSGDFVAHRQRHGKPAGLVPTLDQVLAPFACDHIGHARGRGARHHAQRIAVQINGAFGQAELITQSAQRVLGVERLAVLQSGHGRFRLQSSRSTARTGEASAVVSLSGRAISS